jgi:hypothetical protein
LETLKDKLHDQLCKQEAATDKQHKKRNDLKLCNGELRKQCDEKDRRITQLEASLN